MACPTILNGLIKDCTPSQGGIVEVLLANREDLDDCIVYDGAVYWISMKNGVPFQRYTFRRGSGFMASTWQVAEDARFVETLLSLQFNRMETAKRDAVMQIVSGEFVALVKDANGKWWMLGRERPVVLSEASGVTGTAEGDRNGYAITLRERASTMPYEVPEEVVAALDKDFNADFNVDYTILNQ